MNDHITKTKPEWFLSYGGYKLFNLGIPEVRAYITDIVVNIVRNYDVDGIHFDDYFYPYNEPNEKLRDEATFKKYSDGFANIEDWRRHNVDLVVKNVSEAIRKEKPKVKAHKRQAHPTNYSRRLCHFYPHRNGDFQSGVYPLCRRTTYRQKTAGKIIPCRSQIAIWLG